MNVKYPGIPTVINGNGAIAQVMGHVCGGVIGYPITPSTEIAELYEAFRAEGGCNVWGKHPFFFEPEGEHSAQSGALGAALTGRKYVSNASSSQGILYGLESHYVTVGKKVGGFVLHVAARVVSRHSLNVMAGHDDAYALLPSGYTILFGSNPQEAADLAAIAYKISALSLIPVANIMDGFATSHMLSEALMPEPELLREFIGDPADRIKAPTVAQEILFGAKGRVFQLQRYLAHHQSSFAPGDLAQLKSYLDGTAEDIEQDNTGILVDATLGWIPEKLRSQWRRQWTNAYEKGTRQRVPTLVDVYNPGLTGGVQNQPDFQAGAADHRTHFASDVPRFVRQVMREYGHLTGREYEPVKSVMCNDAETVLIGLGSVTDDAEAVVTYLRGMGRKVGVISVKLLQPFPEAEVVMALRGKRAVTVLERSDATALTSMVTHALFKARENADQTRHAGIPSVRKLPKLTTAIFGLGAHDLQPRHLIAAFKNMEEGRNAPLVYLGSHFFSKEPSPRVATIQQRLKAAYPETEFMALETEPNPRMLPESAFRIRFHSVGGYGTIATGKLLTDILAGVLGLHSKSSPKYGSEKSGAPTNYYITLSPEPIKITNAELEEVEIVISADHKVFNHTNPLHGLADGGTFILQSNLAPVEVWQALLPQARRTIRNKHIRLYIIDGFGVAKRHAPTPDLQTRMMGIAFIGAVCGHVDRVTAGTPPDAMLSKIQQLIAEKFASKGNSVVEGNMAVIREGIEATKEVLYGDPAFARAEKTDAVPTDRSIALSASMGRTDISGASAFFFDREYFEDMVASHFRNGSIAEAPVLPGTGLFMPPGSAAWKDKGMFRRSVPDFIADLCIGCMDCALICPDAAIPNSVHDVGDLLLTAIDQTVLAEPRRETLRAHVSALSDAVREAYRRTKTSVTFHTVVSDAVNDIFADDQLLRNDFGQVADVLSPYPVARARPFFDAMEKSAPGTGGLYSVVIDPWKCSGCLECVTVCASDALVERQQDQQLLDTLHSRFEFMTRTANTPERFTENAIGPNGRVKRLILDRDNYYAVTGGHGACRGCGEVTAIRMVTATNHAIQNKRQKEHTRDLESLIKQLAAKRKTTRNDDRDPNRIERMACVAEILEKRLYQLESGPTGGGVAGMIIANATGCSSVYASTFPYNPYNDPWVNSLFQDAAPLAKGMFEGLSATMAEEFGALRIAKLDLEDRYDPPAHDRFFRYFDWTQFTAEELSLMPNIICIGGDGATYDIGFGAVSRLLTTKTPIKVVVLNSGVYSNTGGQASTASFIGQDSDLARFGSTHSGKQEYRKELGLIAAFHPEVYVAQTSIANPAHFLSSATKILEYNDGPAVLEVYAPCQAEHGIADSAANTHARLALDSRMNPVFVHDPRAGASPSERFSLVGNMNADSDWAIKKIHYVDADGTAKILEMPLTPADFAFDEGRFRKHFHELPGDADGIAVHEYVELSAAECKGKTPFIWSTKHDGHLTKIAVSPTIIQLVLERKKHWRTLQHLSGVKVKHSEEIQHAEL